MSVSAKSVVNRQVLKPVSESQIYQIGELNRAINNHELCLQYQPRYNSTTSKLVTLQALVRWNHPVHGLLYPDVFIPFAEDVGLIDALGLWVFEQSCKDFYILNNKLGDDIRVTINISPLQCEDIQQVQKILDICDKYYISPSRFNFEITKNLSNFHRNKVLVFYKTLVEAGAQCDIVNVDTGHQTTLENLYDLPVNLIKIKTLIKSDGCDSRRNIIIKHMIKLAHELRLKTIAVGVEHTCQRDLLLQLGCEQLQGFIMSKPIKIENISSNILRM